MLSPRIEIKYIDTTEQHGYISVIVNGMLQPSIQTDFTTGNDASIHMGLRRLMEQVYEQGYDDGEKSGKQRISTLIEWSRDW